MVQKHFVNMPCLWLLVVILLSFSCSAPQPVQKQDDSFFTPYSDKYTAGSAVKYYSLKDRKLREEHRELLQFFESFLSQQDAQLTSLENRLHCKTETQSASFKQNELYGRRVREDDLENLAILMDNQIQRLKVIEAKVNEVTSQAAIVSVEPQRKKLAADTVTYDQAIRLYYERRYTEALQIFQTLLANGVSEPLADNCYFWMGVCHFQRGRIGAAMSSFVAVTKFPSSDKNESALFMLGQCYERLGNLKLAQSMFQTLLEKYPETSLRGVAEQKLLAIR
ncbi:MAG: tetratricopeptide repeat protein [Bacteroidetes bacterium]|jgi:TolA-binding protein|nr:tetratricopeptide repeat protein [Bacteroidota bacterium]